MRDSGRRPRRRAWIYAALALLILVAAVLWFRLWLPLPHYEPDADLTLDAEPISPSEYALLQPHEEPYVVDVTADSGRVLLFGVRPTRDPADPRLDSLEARWRAVDPTVLLVERRLGVFVQGLGDPVSTFGETGFAYALARESRVPAYTWEPPRDRVLERDVDHRTGRPDSLDEIRRGVDGVRTGHLLRVLVELARDGHRIFAVAGSNHAVRLDRALHRELGAEDRILSRDTTFSNERFRAVRVRQLAEHAFRVTGEARVFEGTIGYVVEDGHYQLARGRTTATEGAPAWGRFEFVIDYEPGTHGAQTQPTLVLYEESARTGRPTQELIVPLERVSR